MKKFWIGLIGLILISGLIFAQEPTKDKSENDKKFNTDFIGFSLGTSGMTLGAGFKLTKNSYINFNARHLLYSSESSSNTQIAGLEIYSFEINLGAFFSERVYASMGVGEGRIIKGIFWATGRQVYLSPNIGIRLSKSKDGKNSVWLEFGTKNTIPQISCIARLGL